MLYLQGGAILPIGLPIQHVGEASLEDELSLIIALDENGKQLLIWCFLYGYIWIKGNEGCDEDMRVGKCLKPCLHLWKGK